MPTIDSSTIRSASTRAAAACSCCPGGGEERRGLRLVGGPHVAHVDDALHAGQRPVQAGPGREVDAALSRHDDHVDIRGHERVHDVTSDEPCPSDDGDPHGSEPATARRNPSVKAVSAAGNACSAGVPKPTTMPGRRGREPVPVAAEPVHDDPVRGQRGDDLGLGRAVLREVHDGVQAGGDAPDTDRRHGAQRGHELVPPSPVAQPVAADVPVQPSGVDELGQRGLLDDARLPVGQLLGRQATGSTRSSGRTIHPRRSPGARLLLAVPT